MAFVEIWSQRVLNYRAFTTCSTLFPDPQQLLLFRRWVTKGGRWLWKGHGVIQEAISLGFTHSGISRRCDRHPLESDRALKRILPAVTSTDCIMIMVASFSSVTMLMNSMVNDRLAWWLMMNMRGCMTSGSSLCSYWCLWGRPWQRVSDRMVALKVFSFTAWNIKDTELPRIHISAWKRLQGNLFLTHIKYSKARHFWWCFKHFSEDKCTQKICHNLTVIFPMCNEASKLL